MKQTRCLWLLLCLCLVLTLSGCRAGRVPGLDWDPADFTQLELFTGGVPADAQRKITTDPQEIQRAAQALFRFRVQREAASQDVTAGGIGLFLAFTRADGSQEVVHLGGSGTTLRTGAGFYKLRRPASETALWEMVSAPAEPVGESALPDVGSFPGDRQAE